MTLKMLTYTSIARDGLKDGELENIHAAAMTLNALDGITGLLAFNGVYFLQIVEGTPEAIDDLMKRLRSDPRHTNFVIHDEELSDNRSFPDWSMALVRINSGRFKARQDIERALPATASDRARSLMLAMSDQVSD